MKALFKYGWVTLGSVVLLSSAAVIHGQTASVATVPFNFSVGDTRMPAATYRIAEMSTTGAIQMRNTVNGHAVMVSAMLPKGGEAKSSKLVFRCYSGDCFLSEVWYAGESSGHGMNPSKREKEIAQTDRKNVIVAMR